MVDVRYLVRQAVEVVFLEALFDAIDEGAFNGRGDKVGLRLAGRKQEVEQREGRSLRVKDQSNAVSRDRAAQVDLDKPVFGVVRWAGCPAGLRVAVDREAGRGAIGPGVADAPVEGR